MLPPLLRFRKPCIFAISLGALLSAIGWDQAEFERLFIFNDQLRNAAIYQMTQLPDTEADPVAGLLAKEMSVSPSQLRARRARAAMAAMGPFAHRHLIKALESDDPNRRYNALLIFLDLSHYSVPALAASLKSEKPATRAEAFRILAKILNTPLHGESWSIFLQGHPDGAVVLSTGSRIEAGFGGFLLGDVITKIDGRSMKGASLEALSTALAGLEGTRTTVAIQRDGKPLSFQFEKRRLAPQSVRFLRPLPDGFPASRSDLMSQAKQALLSRPDVGLAERLLCQYPPVREQAIADAKRLPNEDIVSLTENLTEKLREPPPREIGDQGDRSRWALEAVQDLGPAALPHLARAAASDDAFVRSSARQWLHGIGRIAIPHLVDALRNHQGVQRDRIAEVTTSIVRGHLPSHPKQRSYAMPEISLATAALRELGYTVEPNPPPTLLERLVGPDKHERNAGIQEAIRLSSADAAGLISELFAIMDAPERQYVEVDGRSVRQSWLAAIALSHLGKGSLPGLIQRLGHRDGEIREDARTGITLIGFAALDTLAKVPIEKDPVLAEAVVRTIMDIASEDSHIGDGMIGLGFEDDVRTVATVVEGSPADRAGIRSGEIVESVNGEATRSLPAAEVLRRIRGPSGTPVVLEVTAPGSNPRRLEIERTNLPYRTLRAVPILVDMLGKTTENVRMTIARGLGYMKAEHPKAIESLIAMASAGSAAEMKAAEDALAMIGEPIIPQLRARALTEDSRARRAAFALLPRFCKGHESRRNWFAPRQERAGAPQGAEAKCSELVSWFLDILQSQTSNPPLRAEAAQALGAAGQDAVSAVPALIAAMRGSDESVSQAATRALLRIETGGAGQAARDYLQVRVDAARREAAWKRITSGDERERRQGVIDLRILARDDEAARVLLERCLEDRRPDVRDEAAVRFDLGRDDERFVPLWVRIATGDYGEAAKNHGVDSLGRLARSSDRALRGLIEVIERGSDAVAVRAAASLSSLGPRAASGVPAVARLLMSTDGEANAAAYRALKGIGSPPAIEALRAYEEAAMDTLIARLPEPTSRPHALTMLELMGPGAKRAVPELIRLAWNDPPDRLGPIVHALGEIGPDADSAVPVLVRLLEVEKVKFAAYSALKKIGTPAAQQALNSHESESMDALIEELRDWKTRGLALYMLKLMGPRAKRAVPELIRLAERETSVSRLPLIHAMGEIGPEADAAVPVLEGFLQTEVNRFRTQEIQNALARIGTERARAALRRFANSTSKEQR